MDIRIELSPKVKTFLQTPPKDKTIVQGGILIGNISVQDAYVTVCAEDFIAAKITHDFVEEVKFSANLWKDMYQQKSTDFPAKKIIGWYLFSTKETPSDKEKEIHRRFFTDPNQVFLISTPQQSINAFRYENAGFLKCPVAETFDNHINAVDDLAYTIENKPIPQDRPGRIPLALKKILAFTAIFTICLLSVMYRDLTKPVREDNVVQDERPRITASNTDETRKAGQSGSRKSLPVADNSSTLTHKKASEASSEKPGTTSSSTHEIPSESAVPPDSIAGKPFTPEGGATYVVQKGDSLWSISEKYYGTGFSFYKIMRENKIINPNTLHVGQVLIIPKE
ncbi:peptidoglycan-binding lysin domain-containing protein [Thermincola ferriacetica]|uniref:Peptidoglycan-binding lysin domain-containing protein n=1 Tax=Thermincola ferriacetica TaxID=281456 RepID=A0A0L6W7M2_9FIRM|nr:LysM peptidoglycan-binding domain-containing protein [Thermincola ferriacetica]KNZ71099.1 peptidoglycan-binding lysin domain-containing protein [Thermincola ferriacetica]